MRKIDNPVPDPFVDPEAWEQRFVKDMVRATLTAWERRRPSYMAALDRRIAPEVRRQMIAKGYAADLVDEIMKEGSHVV
jgi:hypothetical protein